jgi:amino acid adenylation domain-containing protein
MSSLNAAPERWLPDLPYDRAGSAGSQSEQHSLSVTLPLATTALDGLAGATGVSADQVVLAAWVVVLATYSGRSTLSIGVQVDGRLVRTEVDAGADLTLSSLAARLTDALDASGAPGPRDTAIFAFRDDHEGASFPSDIPFALRLESRSGEYRLAASYDPARFERSTVARMVGHVEVVLSQAVETDGAVTVGEAVVVPPTESAVLARWNATQVPYDETATLVSLFGAVGRGSEAVAVQYGDRAVSYAEFEQIARRVAGRLIDLGTQRGSCVGVLCERSVELVAALHGVVMAGAAYVPLDPEYPPDRLDYMVSEAGIRIVLCQDRLGGLIERTDVTMVDLGQLSAERGDGSTAEPYAVAPDDVAYVIYTSGSTGRPKGVANAHRGIANRLLWMQDRFQLHPGDVVLQKTPFSFDVSVWELFWPLQVGARLVIAEPGGHRDPAYLVQTIVRHGVDTIHFVPSMLRLFLDHPAAASCTSLRRVVCSGEALTRDLQDRFFAVLPDAELHNLYGPTEAAVDVTAWQCRPGDPRSLVPIGAPIHNTTIHILDGRLRPVPIGVSGELHIGGVQVAVGYVNQPGLTAERFIPDPFDPPGRLYRTGDLARWLPDGQIEFLGRLDHQIKLRGQRIELGEVEATLGEHPAVLESAVTLAEIGGEPGLVAHVVWRPGSADEAELRSFLERRLPAIMVPGHFVAHDALPLTSSGKLDRKALTAPLAERPAAGAPVRGADDLEQFLLDCWRDVLGHEAVGPDDRVFDLGATSLQAAAFVNRVQRELGEFIYVVTVFTAPTVHAYAALLQREYPAAIARRFGVAATRTAGATQPRVDEAAVQRVDGAVPRFGPYPSWRQGRPNKPAVFILSPPRSGTTLLRVMLAGHSRLFAAPELQLLNFDTLPQRRASLAGVHAPWREGTIRAVMELERCDADSATELMESHERAGSTAKAFFGWLQERAGDRTVVDKSPTYALDVDALRNAEHGFDAARYIHLVRDPHTMSRSFASYHMDQILPLSEQPYGGRALGELVWTISHRNILAFTEAVPEERVLRLHFEDLIADPRAAMLRVSSFLGLDFEEALVNPYDDLERKMVDGLHPESTPMGDTRMLERGRIDPKAGAGVAADTADSVLGEPTRRLAAVLRDPVRRTGDSVDRRRFADIARRRRAARRTSG